MYCSTSWLFFCDLSSLEESVGVTEFQASETNSILERTGTQYNNNNNNNNRLIIY